MTPLTALLGAATGLVCGSFIATAAMRAVRSEQALAGRSRCDGCGRPLGFAQTVPVVSYVICSGACRACGGRIDPIHPLGELAGGLIGVAVVSASSLPSAVAIGAAGLALLGAAVIDARSRRLPDSLTILITVCALSLGAMAGRLLEGLAAAALMIGTLLLIRRFVRPGGSVSLGLGDVKLLGALSIWTGIATPWALMVAALITLLHLKLRPSKDGRVPFGPAISASFFAFGVALETGTWPRG